MKPPCIRPIWPALLLATPLVFSSRNDTVAASGTSGLPKLQKTQGIVTSTKDTDVNGYDDQWWIDCNGDEIPDRLLKERPGEESDLSQDNDVGDKVAATVEEDEDSDATGDYWVNRWMKPT